MDRNFVNVNAWPIAALVNGTFEEERDEQVARAPLLEGRTLALSSFLALHLRFYYGAPTPVTGGCPT